MRIVTALVGAALVSAGGYVLVFLLLKFLFGNFSGTRSLVALVVSVGLGLTAGVSSFRATMRKEE